MSEIETKTKWKPRAATRCTVPPKMRGIGRFGMWWEMHVFSAADVLCSEYRGGVWQSVKVEGAHYWRLDSDRRFTVHTPLGDCVEMSADAFGVTCTLYVCSQGSFELQGKPGGDFLADNFHALHGAMVRHHPEAAAILRAID